MAVHPEKTLDSSPSGKNDTVGCSEVEGPERTWEEDFLCCLLDEWGHYRTNPAALDEDTERWTRVRHEAEIKRLDFSVQITHTNLKQTEFRKILEQVSEKKKQCNQKLIFNGERMQRRCLSYNVLVSYLPKKNSELLAKSKELEDVQKRRQQINNEVSVLCSKGYSMDSAPVSQLVVEDYYLLTKERQLMNEEQLISDTIRVGQDRMKQIPLEANKLRSEDQQLKQKTESLNNEEKGLQSKLDNLAKLLDEQKNNLKTAVKMETAANKSLLKLTFIKSLIKSDEREQALLESVDLDVRLNGNQCF